MQSYIHVSDESHMLYFERSLFGVVICHSVGVGLV